MTMPVNKFELPPLSLYVHIPWCVKKCPYCDFNSHEGQKNLPEKEYVDALLKDLFTAQESLYGRKVQTVFFGGGTPSLFSAEAIASILIGIDSCLGIAANAEITLEANPGTAEQKRFLAYKAAGVNRLSVGVQSFQNEKLLSLGRIHGADEAKRALEMAHSAGFLQINVDLMYGLPNQTVKDAEEDLKIALNFSLTHLSWYNLTIEKNTGFYRAPPALPAENIIADIEETGLILLEKAGFYRYEISAYAKDHSYAKHNLNYWLFGDYLGIGAGAHSKITDSLGKVVRFWKYRTPYKYLANASSSDKQNTFVVNREELQSEEILFEFMLNALRLTNGFGLDFFSSRTGLSVELLAPKLHLAQEKKLLTIENGWVKPTKLGVNFLNDLILLFSTHKEIRNN